MTKDDLMNILQAVQQEVKAPKGVDVILVLVERDTGAVGWASTISTNEAINYLQDVVKSRVQ